MIQRQGKWQIAKVKWHMVSRLLPFAICLLPFSMPSAAWSLTITNPAPNQVLNGPVTFSVDTGGDPSIVAVEYFQNGQTFFPVGASPATQLGGNANAVFSLPGCDPVGVSETIDVAPPFTLGPDTTNPCANAIFFAPP